MYSFESTSKYYTIAIVSTLKKIKTVGYFFHNCKHSVSQNSEAQIKGDDWNDIS